MKAMVLAAGFGTRLGALTQHTPKALMPVAGRRMLDWVLDWLMKNGIDEVVINLHHLGEQIRRHLLDHPRQGLTVNFSEEAEILGTGGGLWQARRYLESEDHFFLVNADVYSDANLLRLAELQRERKGLGLLAVAKREEKSYLCFDQNGLLRGWAKATDPETCLTRRAFCGIQILSNRIFRYLQGRTAPFSTIEAFVAAAAAGEHLYAEDISDVAFHDIGTPESLERLNEVLAVKRSAKGGP